MIKLGLFILLFTGILSGNLAYGAQLEAGIMNDSNEIQPSFKFLRVISIEYPNGGNLAEQLSGQESIIEFSATNQTPGAMKLIEKLNSSLIESGSTSRIDDLVIHYYSSITTRSDSTVIEYNIELVPTIYNHIRLDGKKVLVDTLWRGLSVDESAVISSIYGNFNINSPAAPIQYALPNVYPVLANADTNEVLSIPLLDASGIGNLPLSQWHYLYDPTGKMQGPIEDYGFEGSIISHYSMGECNIFISVCDDKEWISSFTTDTDYTIRAVESRDDAVITIEGYTSIISDSGILGVTSQAPDVIDDRGNSFPVSIIYGMAGIAVICAVLFFWFSHRKTKNENDTQQTGIDPSHLRAYQTSTSAGGYKTNRGEAYLMSNIPAEYKNDLSKSPV